MYLSVSTVFVHQFIKLINYREGGGWGMRRNCFRHEIFSSPPCQAYGFGMPPVKCKLMDSFFQPIKVLENLVSSEIMLLISAFFIMRQFYGQNMFAQIMFQHCHLYFVHRCKSHFHLIQKYMYQYCGGHTRISVYSSCTVITVLVKGYDGLQFIKTRRKRALMRC